jgi:hypothetical protein
MRRYRQRPVDGQQTDRQIENARLERIEHALSMDHSTGAPVARVIVGIESTDEWGRRCRRETTGEIRRADSATN